MEVEGCISGLRSKNWPQATGARRCAPPTAAVYPELVVRHVICAAAAVGRSMRCARVVSQAGCIDYTGT
jgi:hypothetical protein